nr:hypothetical protein [Phenylobacterium sp.]
MQSTFDAFDQVLRASAVSPAEPLCRPRPTGPLYHEGTPGKRRTAAQPPFHAAPCHGRCPVVRTLAHNGARQLEDNGPTGEAAGVSCREASAIASLAPWLPRERYASNFRSS